MHVADAATKRLLLGFSALAFVAASAGLLSSAGPASASIDASSLVPIAPCRLLDTRPAPDNVGTRIGALGAGETFVADVWGTNGKCTIPSGATGVIMNVTAVNPTAPSFLTVYPAGAARPLAASLNWVAGQPPTPNAVSGALSGTGQLAFYNLAGKVDLAVDLVAYYVPSTQLRGPAGPAGAKGDIGPAGPAGPRGADAPVPAHVLRVAPSGARYQSVGAALAAIGDNGPASPYLIDVAPGVYSEPAGISLKDHVDIRGAGQGITTITSATTTVHATGAIHATLSGLTIESTAATAPVAVLLDATVAGGVVLRDAAAQVSTGTLVGNGSARAIVIDGSAPLLDRVTATAIGGHDGTSIDIRNGAAPTLDAVTVTIADSGTLSTGIAVDASTLTAHRVVVTGKLSGTAGITGITATGSSTVTISDSEVHVSAPQSTTGIAVTGSASVLHDTDVTATSSQPVAVIGIQLTNGTHQLARVTASANGGSLTAAVYGIGATTSTIDGLQASASGGATAQAVAFGGGSTAIRNSTLRSNGTNAIALTGGSAVLTSTELHGSLSYKPPAVTCAFVTTDGAATSCP